jgi:hypothetical protein
VEAELQSTASLLRSKIEEAELHPETIELLAYQGLIAVETGTPIIADDQSRFLQAMEIAISDIDCGLY